MPLRRTPLMLLLALAAGCGSRWARDDRDYADKYPHHTDNVAKMAKQAIDARHVMGKRGLYAGFAGSDKPAGAGAELGLFVYPRSWLETRIGGALLGHDGDHPVSGGVVAGARVQPPCRLAPFAGVAGYAGWGPARRLSDDEEYDEDDDLWDDLSDPIVGVSPELGVHYWLTSRARVTGSADYRFTTDGRGSDSLFYGVSLAILGKGQSSPASSGSRDSKGWSFAPSEATTIPSPIVDSKPYEPPTNPSTAPDVDMGDVLHEAGSIYNTL